MTNKGAPNIIKGTPIKDQNIIKPKLKGRLQIIKVEPKLIKKKSMNKNVQNLRGCKLNCVSKE